MKTEAVAAVGVSQVLGHAPVLRDVGFTLPAGEVLALLGPSGCGKTTLLRLIAGLLAPSRGAIRIAGRLVADASDGRFVPPEQRDLGMVFQDYALWPHLTIGQNIAFPLEMRGMSRSERERKVAEALARVGLAGFGARRPADLSGGQQQRVAIARAIVSEPRLVLFDEPLSNLDRELRETLAGEIAELLARLGLTAIYVTHDQSEAFALADTVVVMRAGTILQSAAPETLVAAPASPAVAEFLKLGAIVPLEARADGWWIQGGGARLLSRADGPAAGGSACVLVPTQAVRLGAPNGAAATGTVIRSQFRGDRHVLTIRPDGGGAVPDLQIGSPTRATIGERTGVFIEPARLRWFLQGVTDT